MKRKTSAVPKLKKGMWFVAVRGSYVPMTPQAWLLHALLVSLVVAVMISTYDDTRSLPVVAVTMVLELIGLGAIFTHIASKKS